MYRIMETGCAKWIKVMDDLSIRYTSDSSDATIFTKPLKDVLNEHPKIARYKDTLYTSDAF